MEQKTFTRAKELGGKKRNGHLGKPLPFSGLSFPLTVMGWSRGAQIPGTLSPCPGGLHKSDGLEKAAMAILGLWEHTLDIPEPTLWPHYPQTLRPRLGRPWHLRIPQVDPSPDPSGLAPHSPHRAYCPASRVSPQRPGCLKALPCLAGLLLIAPDNPGGGIWAILQAPSTLESLPINGLN